MNSGRCIVMALLLAGLGNGAVSAEVSGKNAQQVAAPIKAAACQVPDSESEATGARVAAPAAKSAPRVTSQSSGRSKDKAAPASKSAPKSVYRLTAKSASKPTAKPAAKSSGSPVAAPAASEGAKPAGNTAGQPDRQGQDLSGKVNVIDESTAPLSEASGGDLPSNAELELQVTGASKPDLHQLVESYSLADTLEMAIRQNPTIRVSDENVAVANAAYNQACSQKNLQLRVANNTTWQNRQTSGNIVTLEGLSNQLTTSLSYLLTTFGSVENQITAAYLQIGVQALNAASVKHEIRHAVKQAFFNRLKADSTVGVAKLNLEVTNQSLADSQKMFRRGIMARFDVIQAELQVTEAIEQLARAQNSVESTNATFLNLLSEPTLDAAGNWRVVSLVKPEEITVDSSVTVEDLQRLALARRFEILAIDRSLEVANKVREAAECENNPQITLSANHIFSPGYRTYPCSVYQLNLGVSWSLYDGGLKSGKLAEADANIRQLQASREEQENNIRLAVEQAWLNFKLTDVTMQTARKRVEAAWVYHDMARQRFLNGLGTSLEVQDALNSLNQARQAYVVASYDRDLAFVDLEYCVGVDFDDRRLVVTADMYEPVE